MIDGADRRSGVDDSDGPGRAGRSSLSTNPDGSSKWIVMQLTNFNGFAVMDFATRKEIKRIKLPGTSHRARKLVPGGGEVSHGLAVTADQKDAGGEQPREFGGVLYWLPDLGCLGSTDLSGKGAAWMSLSLDSKTAYISNSMSNTVSAIDIASMKEVALIPVGLRAEAKRGGDACRGSAATSFFSASWFSFPRRDRSLRWQARVYSPKLPAAMTHGARFQAASDRSLLVRFGDDISIETNEQVRRLLRLLEAEPIAHVRNLNPAYCSLLITFDALKLTHRDLEEIICAAISTGWTAGCVCPNRGSWKFPCVMGASLAPIWRMWPRCTGLRRVT